jgi:hypothetical protein
VKAILIPRKVQRYPHFMNTNMNNKKTNCIIMYYLMLIIFLSSFSCSKDKSPQSGSLPPANNTLETQEAQPQRSPQPVTEGTTSGKEKQSDSKNTPPEIIRVKLMPEVFKPGDTLYVDVEARDRDGDGITFFYEWFINGELVGTERQLNSPLKRGDKLIINIKPFDGKDYGKIITLKREILNLPPVIVEHKDYHFDGNIWTYQLNASDPDGDPLTYALKEALPGMTIDNSGLIKWNVPPDFKGKARVTVSVTDGHGGEASQSFTLEITPQ